MLCRGNARISENVRPVLTRLCCCNRAACHVLAVPAAFNVKAVLVLSEVVPDASAALDGISAAATASAFITDIER